MGLMICNRKGCYRVMCDLYSHKFGYICSNCYHELIESKMEIKDFMQTAKEDMPIKRTISIEEIEAEFQDVGGL